jgi:uncharacterized protein YcbK (DUF882 family)
LALAGGPLKAMAATSHRQERSLSFHNLHTGESLARPYRVGDTYISSSLAEFDRLLRDFRTGEVKPIDPALLDFLHDLRIAIGGDQPFHVISGYRSPKTNAQLASKSGGVAKKSLHMKGMAIDVRLPHQDLDKLRQAAIGLRLGGVGYYPGSDFVHLDTGRVRFW